MIQSNYKPVELKAPESVKAPVKSHETHKPSKLSAAEKNEFKKELKSVSESDEPKVKPVEVSSDKALRKPSSLINKDSQGEGNPETVSPKVFDPAMTKDVQNLINPEVVDAEGVSPEALFAKMKVAPSELTAIEGEAAVEMTPEMTQAMLKTAQVNPEALATKEMTGRSPAIDFAQSEVDPQLLNMEDFVAQKNMVQKKALPNQGAYGMKNPAANKLALESDLKSTQVVKDISMLENSNAGTGSSPMNSQQFILNNLAEQGSNKMTDVQVPVKTFDMSQIKTADADKIMNQISDYIVQAKASKEPTVSMRVNHQDLGMIDITVMKSGVVNSDAVAINIGAHSADGKNFFQQNSKDLFSHLSNAGINVSDMKVETASNSSKSDFDMNQQSQKHASSNDRQFGSEQNQRRHDQDRRQELWRMFNKEAA